MRRIYMACTVATLALFPARGFAQERELTHAAVLPGVEDIGFSLGGRLVQTLSPRTQLDGELRVHLVEGRVCEITCESDYGPALSAAAGLSMFLKEGAASGAYLRGEVGGLWDEGAAFLYGGGAGALFPMGDDITLQLEAGGQKVHAGAEWWRFLLGARWKI